MKSNHLFKKASMRAVALSAALGLIAMSCSGSTKEAQGTNQEKKIILVKIETIQPKTFQQKITLPAMAKANREVTIASEITGRVIKLGFDKGDRVTKGKVLVWLNDSSISAGVAQAKAAHDLSALDHRKLKALADQKAGVSEFRLEKARLGLEAAKARLSSLRAEQAKHVIKAPIDGFIADKTTEIGSFVGPGAPLARLVSADPIKISIGIPEVAIADFAIGKEASLRFDAYPDREYKGKVTYLSGEVNRNARVFESEIKLPNPDMTIMPEMSAKVTFVRKELPDSILIPQTAVVELSDGHAVFVVDGNNVAHRRKVKIDDTANEMALVSEGLKPGERLVIRGQRSLIDGDKVVVSK